MNPYCHCDVREQSECNEAIHKKTIDCHDFAAQNLTKMDRTN
ncbi:hypothetical protein [Helicobacter sp. 23-1045]